MRSVPTCFVLGETGVGKSTFVNAITRSNECKISYGPEACTKYCQLVKTELANKTIQFIDTPGLLNSYEDEASIKEIKNEISKHSNIQFLFILLSFQQRISRSLVEAIKTYKKIFPFSDFWNHVIIIYTNYYERRGNKKSEVLAALSESMKCNNIDLPPHIPIFFVDLSEDREDNWRHMVEAILKNGLK